MSLFCRQGDLLRLRVPLLSGWQGLGIAAEDVEDDGDPDTVVAFYKKDQPDAAESIALIGDVELVAWDRKLPIHETCPPSGCDICQSDWPCARLERAKAEPTQADLRQLFDDQSGYINDEQVMWWADFHKAVRAALERWGR